MLKKCICIIAVINLFVTWLPSEGLAKTPRHSRTTLPHTLSLRIFSTTPQHTPQAIRTFSFLFQYRTIPGFLGATPSTGQTYSMGCIGLFAPGCPLNWVGTLSPVGTKASFRENTLTPIVSLLPNIGDMQNLPQKFEGKKQRRFTEDPRKQNRFISPRASRRKTNSTWDTIASGITFLAMLFADLAYSEGFDTGYLAGNRSVRTHYEMD